MKYRSEMKIRDKLYIAFMMGALSVTLLFAVGVFLTKLECVDRHMTDNCFLVFMPELSDG